MLGGESRACSKSFEVRFEVPAADAAEDDGISGSGICFGGGDSNGFIHQAVVTDESGEIAAAHAQVCQESLEAMMDVFTAPGFCDKELKSQFLAKHKPRGLSHVFVSAAAEVHENRARLHLARLDQCVGHRVRTLECGDDALLAAEHEEGVAAPVVRVIVANDFAKSPTGL